MPPKEKPAVAQKTAKKKSNKDDKTMHPPTAKPLIISTSNFSIEATNPLTVSYYADGAHDYANVVIRVNGTMRKGEYQVQVAKDGHSILFVCSIRSFDKKISKKS
jgi:hypothetical protein